MSLWEKSCFSRSVWTMAHHVILLPSLSTIWEITMEKVAATTMLKAPSW